MVFHIHVFCFVLEANAAFMFKIVPCTSTDMCSAGYRIYKPVLNIMRQVHNHSIWIKYKLTILSLENKMVRDDLTLHDVKAFQELDFPGK